MIGVPERLHNETLLNRAQRRQEAKHSNCRGMENRVISAIKRYNNAEAEFNIVRSETSYNLGATIYFGQGAGYEFFEATQTLPATVEQSRLLGICGPHQNWLLKVQYPDYRSLRVNGLSLGDIERMNLPLRAFDIAKITRFFKVPFFGEPPRSEQAVRELAVYAAVDPLANPEKVNGRKANPLRERLAAYFEFQKAFLTAQNTETMQDQNFINTLMWTGIFFGQSLGLYISASLGTSPSSTMKLFKEHVYNSGFGWMTPIGLKEVSEGLQFAYHPEGINALPEEIQPYLSYDSKADKEITRKLVLAYSGKSSTPDYQEAEELKERFIRNRGVIEANATDLGENSAYFQLRDHPVIGEVLVGFRRPGSHLSRNVTLVLLSREGPSHLTLDLNGKGRLIYGIPAGLLKKVPHIEELLVRDVVGSILDQAEAKDRVGKFPRKIDIPSIVETPLLKVEPQPQTAEKEEIELEIPIPPKPPKRKQLRTAISLVRDEPGLPIPAETYKRVYTVKHDEELVKRCMGRVNGADIERVMKAIERFEVGAVRSKKVVSEKGVVRIRMGDWRIKFEYIGGNSYSLVEIVSRNEAYTS